MLYNRRFLCVMFLVVKISTADTSTIENAPAISRRDVEAKENLEIDPATPKESQKVSQTEKYTAFRIMGEDLEQIDTKTLYTSINKITDHEKLSFLFTIVNFDNGTTLSKQYYTNTIKKVFNVRKAERARYSTHIIMGLKAETTSAASNIGIKKVLDKLKSMGTFNNLIINLVFDYLHDIAYDVCKRKIIELLRSHIAEANKSGSEANDSADKAVEALISIAKEVADGVKVINSFHRLKYRQSKGLKKIVKKFKKSVKKKQLKSFFEDEDFYFTLIPHLAQFTYRVNFVKCCQEIASGLLPELKIEQNQDKFREFYVKTYNGLKDYIKDVPPSAIEELTKIFLDSYVFWNDISFFEEPLRVRFKLMLPSLRDTIRKTKENKTYKVKNITSFVCRGERPEEMHMPALIELLRETETNDTLSSIQPDRNQDENLCREIVGDDFAMLAGVRYNPNSFDEAEYLKILDEDSREVTNPATEVRTQRFCNII